MQWDVQITGDHITFSLAEHVWVSILSIRNVTDLSRSLSSFVRVLHGNGSDMVSLKSCVDFSNIQWRLNWILSVSMYDFASCGRLLVSISRSRWTGIGAIYTPVVIGIEYLIKGGIAD